MADEDEDITSRFPKVPPAPELPEVPRATSELPPHPHKEPTGIAPGSMQKAALATQAAGALVTPVIVLAVGGYFLDKKFGTNWIAFIGVVVGFIVGVMGLMKILQKISD